MELRILFLLDGYCAIFFIQPLGGITLPLELVWTRQTIPPGHFKIQMHTGSNSAQVLLSYLEVLSFQETAFPIPMGGNLITFPHPILVSWGGMVDGMVFYYKTDLSKG